jgi:hypothetical protein
LADLIQRSVRRGREGDNRLGSVLGAVGLVESGLVFRFILSPCKVRVSDGTKEFVLFLFEIDFEKAFFIAIPEEVAEFVDEVPDFQGDLDFLLIFHFSPPKFAILSRFGIGFSVGIGGYP